MKDKKKIAGSIIKTQTKVLAYVVICLVIVIMGSSYALFFQVQHNTTNQVITAGNLKITYVNGTKIDATKAECFEPMTDAVAKTKTTCTYTLNVTNTSDSLPSTFKLNLKKNTTTAVDLSRFNVIVKKGTGSSYTDIAGFPKALTNTDTNTLLTESIGTGATVNYSIQVYPVDGKINEDTDDGKVISLNIEGVGEVDVSKANLK